MHFVRSAIRLSPRRGVAVFALAGCLGLAACGEPGSTDRDVASLDTTDRSSSSTPPGGSGESVSDADRDDALLEYAKCMRDHGVDMPDPKAGSNGAAIEVPMPESGGELPARTGTFGPDELSTDPTIKAANTACQPILDGVFGDAPQLSPEEEVKARDYQLAFTKCMRENGVDVPDPKPDSGGGSGSSDELQSFGIDAASPEFIKAAETCQKRLGEGGTTSGDVGVVTPANPAGNDDGTGAT